MSAETSPAYLPRIADGELARRRRALGAVLVDGPKACGKTETASQVAATIYRMDRDKVARALVDNEPDALFSPPAPILFDEWQETPEIWNIIRHKVDERRTKGEFLLTGSSTPALTVRRHSGAGRMGTVRMRPMSLFESRHSSGEVSLAELFQGERQTARDGVLGFSEVLERIVIGGWPDLIDVGEADARDWLDGYVDNAVEVDVQRLGARRDPVRIRRLLESLARGTGQAVKSSRLQADVGGDGGPVAGATLNNYLDALTRLMLIEDSPAWRPHLRSRTPLRTSPVRYFVDPSLAMSALKAGSADLLADPEVLGFQFEALVMRDLRIYAQPLRATVSSWRDSSGHEVDAIVSVRDNLWGAVEVKVSPSAVDSAADSLLRFVKKVDPDRHGQPAFLAVIVSHGRYAYLRRDGVHVIPIGCLGP
ncbi:MAG: DUF4143 domain-containing protein [Cellulomonadaceae bacterium]|jgi:predicted AAA+ superfamily ATPase|nr:DUF4143 domain-containing protein [Cellulomonadaceae bacterium]